MNRIAKRLVRSIPILALAAVASASVQFPRIGSSRTVPWGGSQTEAYSRSVTGFFDADQSVDMAAIVNDQLYVAHSPGLYGARSTEIVEAFDVAVLPDATGGPDHLVVVNGSGLVRVTWQAPSGTWSLTPLESAAWAGAQALAVRTGATGNAEVVGLMQDQLSVRRWREVLGGHEDQELFALPTPARDLLGFNFDDAGEDDLALMTPSGVSVYSIAGVPLASHDYPGFASVDIAIVDQGGLARQWVAWIASAPGGYQYLATIGQEGLTVQEDLGYIAAVALGSGDVNGDGSTDLLISQEISHHVGLFFNLGQTGPKFDSSDPVHYQLILVGPVGPAAGSLTQPVTGDLDGDGDEEFLCLVLATQSLYIGQGTLVDESRYLPRMLVDEVQQTASASFENTDDGQALRFTLSVQSPLPASATHVELVLFVKDSLAARTDASAVQRVLVPVSEGVLRTTHIELDVELLLSDVALPLGTPQFETLYFWHQRLIEAGPGPTFPRLHAFPSQGYGLQGSSEDANDAYLRSLAENGISYKISLSNLRDLPPGDEDGSVSCLPNIPDFEDDLPPMPPSF